jgi:hypothetical protein
MREHSIDVRSRADLADIGRVQACPGLEAASHLRGGGHGINRHFIQARIPGALKHHPREEEGRQES